MRPDNSFIKLCKVCKSTTNEFEYGSATCKPCLKEIKLLKKNDRVKNGLCPECGRVNDRLPHGKRCNICNNRGLDKNFKLKAAAIQKYGGKCTCCGESTFDFLTFDHINNDGKSHRVLLFGENRAGTSFYRWLNTNKIQDNIQLLCANCHLAKTNWSTCPHTRMQVKIDSRHRHNWDQYYMNFALAAAKRSTCNRLSVGAAIAKDRLIVSTGYNGADSNKEHCIDVGCDMSNGHCVRTIHAEINAICNALKNGLPTDGATIYVTHSPCVTCYNFIVASGITTIIYNTAYGSLYPVSANILMKKL